MDVASAGMTVDIDELSAEYLRTVERRPALEGHASDAMATERPEASASPSRPLQPPIGLPDLAGRGEPTTSRIPASLGDQLDSDTEERAASPAVGGPLRVGSGLREAPKAPERPEREAPLTPRAGRRPASMPVARGPEVLERRPRSRSMGPLVFAAVARAPVVRRCRSSEGSGARRSCPLCLEPLSAETRESFCGAHSCCAPCAAECAKQQIWMGRLPECFEPDCRRPAEPLFATRLLTDPRDHERYLALALWSNPCVEACPKCRCLLYADMTAPSQGCGTCPSCAHVFCVDCRCPRHDGEGCEAALSRAQSRRSSCDEASASQMSAFPSRAAPGEVCRVASLTHLPEDLEMAAYLNGFKQCPRCRVVVEKCDDGCEHMRCWQCGHEFCWLCMADRAVIFAHGNHYHRMTCQLHAPYDGPDAEAFLPERCLRCRMRGAACEAPKRLPPSPTTVGQYYTALVDACARWIRDGNLFFGTCSGVTLGLSA